VDASLTKAEFLAWLDCGRQPSCEQLKLIIESFQVGSWNAFYTDLHELNLAFDELVSEVGLKYNNQEETKAQDVFRLINEASGVIHTYRKATKAFNDVNITDNLVSLFPTIFRKKGDDFYRIQDENGFNIKMFGAVGDKVTDDSNAIQNAVLFCEFFQIKTLRVPTGNYLINSKVIFNRGGVRIVGEGALSREESWIGFATEEYPENFPLGISETYHGCTFTIPKNSVGFEFSKSVVDNVYFSDVQFLAKDGRTIGNTRAIDFLAEFWGPTWNFVIERCNFRGFNKAINISSPTQYCVAFVNFSHNSMAQCDDILFFADIPLGSVSNFGSRNMAWGLNFTHNKCHDNSRLIRGCFAKDLVKISQNNFEGSITYSDGTSPKYAIDLEISTCDVIFEGNHAESVNHDIFFATSYFRDKNGDRHDKMQNQTRGSDCTVTIKGNNFNGVQNNKVPITLEGVALYDYDNNGARLHGCNIKFSGSQNSAYVCTEEAKKEISLYVFAVNDVENIVYREDNGLIYQDVGVGQTNKDSFIMGTPFGQKQVTKFKVLNGEYFNYTRLGTFLNAKYYGVSFLINANKSFAFFPTVLFFITYTLNGEDKTLTENVSIKTNNFRKGWNIVTAVFPKLRLPTDALIKDIAVGMPSGELLNESVIVDTTITVFAIEKDVYSVCPFFKANANYYEKKGTFEIGQMFYDNMGVLNICTKAGTIGESLEGVTATGVQNQNFFTCSDASKLTTGGYINILGYYYKINNIEGNKVFISSPFFVDQPPNSAINWDAPTFKTITLS
jgi:hypothetical protein